MCKTVCTRVLLVPNAPTVTDLPQTQACWVAVCEVGSPRRLGGPWNIPPPPPPRPCVLGSHIAPNTPTAPHSQGRIYSQERGSQEPVRFVICIVKLNRKY
ncbi:hypothetical protein HanPSC8_Chr09g0349531 [Helianthus annuus]|nr:hypothetical protein HanPSC8_Chr09g0349531 [Helianthus annuus]